MRHLSSLILLLLLPLAAVAQTYKFIGVEDGLSNRRVYHIQQDSLGYMWFLTNEGIDRYNGREVKHYNFSSVETDTNYPLYLGWPLLDNHKILWFVGKEGSVFRYSPVQDKFLSVYKSPKAPFSCSFMDSKETIWMCSSRYIILHDIHTGITHQQPNFLQEEIVDICEIGNDRYLLASEGGVRMVERSGHTVSELPLKGLEGIGVPISSLYYHVHCGKLCIGTYGRGVLVYDLVQESMVANVSSLSGVNITTIKSLDEEAVLVATEGWGIHQLNLRSFDVCSYVGGDHESNQEMNRTNINDIYIDGQKRVWASYFPDGVVVIDKRYKNYRRIRQLDGDKQALSGEQVHSIMEDGDGDLWFGTGNGITLYRPATGEWRTFLTRHQQTLPEDMNRLFLTLCEVSPGVVWAGGYTSGVYVMDKRANSVEYFNPSRSDGGNLRPDKYIRQILKDSQGNVWVGGYYNLRCFGRGKESVRHYPGISYITSLAEYDENRLWVGTVSGLHLLERESGTFQTINLHEEVLQINTLYQGKDGLLYIGTNGSGLITYDYKRDSVRQYHKDNCALVSNTINAILPERDGKLMMSTENGISCLNLDDRKFCNWTKEAGLNPSSFNIASGVMCRNGNYIFGSNEGAVEFSHDSEMPAYNYTPMLFSNFRISYQEVYPGSEDSPLNKDINETEELRLKYSQNNFSFKISSINYDVHDNALFYWKFEGDDKPWTRLPADGDLRFTNLASGNYRLLVRAIPKEEPYRFYEERSLSIFIAPPFWLSSWFLGGCLVFAAFVLLICFRFIVMRKQQKIAEEKTGFFINTAHDIRTPLTLIRTPLEEAVSSGELTENVAANVETALHGVDILMSMTTTLLNFEQAEVYSLRLRIAECELHGYLQELCRPFMGYARSKHIAMTLEADFGELRVWLDKEKMGSILKNVINNALKYTQERGEILVSATDAGTRWDITVKDTGIGIPEKEQKHLFKQHFRASNAINQKISGSGMGLMLVAKLVHIHGGKIHVSSKEGVGTVVSMSFPKNKEQMHRYTEISDSHCNETAVPDGNVRPLPPTKAKPQPSWEEKPTGARLLVAEDNDELRNILYRMLSPLYDVRVCEDGKTALRLVHEFHPELVVADVMMPEMRGDDLCRALKGELETSHIPVILLTALAAERCIIQGLAAGADEYITKPFSNNLLMTAISTQLRNRELLRKSLAALEPPAHNMKECANCNTDLEWKFISSVRENVERRMDQPDFNIDVLCSALNMSRTSFYNKLKALTGQTPSEFVRTVRMKHALKLLQEDRFSITEVAEATGFSDAKYFREVFKKHFGSCPSQHIK